MIIEKIVEVFVPPPGPVTKIPAIGPVTISQEHLLISREDPHPLRVSSVLVSEAGQTYQLLLPQKETEVVQNLEVGVSLPVVEVDQLVQRLETYLKTRKIASQVFAKMVLGVSASVFSNMKRKAKALPRKELKEKELVIWGRVQFYLEDLATSTSNILQPTQFKAKASTSRRKKGKGNKSRGSGNSVDLVDMEFLLPEEDLLSVAVVQDLLVTPGDPEEIFWDYPDIKLEELDTDTMSGDLEVSQFIEVYYEVLPFLGSEIEIAATVDSLKVDDI